MSSSVERSLERAYAMGVRNREILGLLAQHCRNAVVEYAGGHGMAEAATGLPIDMRTIRCPFARNRVGAAMNKEWIAVDFYRANCVGCPHRDPVGVPNLATFVAGLDEQTAHEAEQLQRRVEAAERRRRERAERRSSTATGEALAAATVLEDLDAVDDPTDIEPGAEHDPRDSARRRIVETARRAPEYFSQAVVDQLRELATQPGHAWVFEALRHVARTGHADPRATVQLALDVLALDRVGFATPICARGSSLAGFTLLGMLCESGVRKKAASCLGRRLDSRDGLPIHTSTPPKCSRRSRRHEAISSRCNRSTPVKASGISIGSHRTQCPRSGGAPQLPETGRLAR